MSESPADTPPRAHRWRALSSLPWQKLALETFAVVLGVVLGMQVSNWNDNRREQREVGRLLQQLKPELAETIAGFDDVKGYYAVTRHYADQALAGWAGDRSVSDRDFVIAAYQASQITGGVTNDAAWSTIFGSDQLRQIDDGILRRMLVRVLSASSEPISVAAADSPYRPAVRRLIPIDIQDAIRIRCGDQWKGAAVTGLPRECDVALPADKVASAAATLRQHPNLAGDLRWHFANIAAFVQNVNASEIQMQELHDRIATGR